MTDYHIPVLRNESIKSLDIRDNGIYVDLTFGGGGHSKAILEKLGKKGKLIAFDQDKDAIANIPDDNRILFIHCNFRYMRGALRAHGFSQVNGILADLGVSSHHFDASERGFSFRFDTPLDMRMNQKASFSAMEVIGNYNHQELLRIFKDYGELQMPHKIASCIEQAREKQPITTTGELLEAVKPCAPKRDESKFYAKLFQAIRIEVNHEMESLKMMLEQSKRMLAENGRLAIITYHSLEDRLVKNYMKSCNFEGRTEKDIFGNSRTELTPLSKVITPSEEEITLNPRARSAKLRVAVKNRT
ncbi:MAG TPA: 16S rRNA (cytosine(1402)-N(4))-methyltransferase RsmH [Candidatus Avirikenella pullistercoris]|nr:16S rRNA (cytosine(1402)-N(4))-methyltransferase RsmH [Candidatus Avirikenella pullistercoris]